MFYGLLFRNMLLLFRRNRFALVALMLAVLPLFSSCLSEDDALLDDQPSIRYNMLVTVRTDSEGRTYFRLDDQTTLEPVDWTDTLGKQTRALLYGILLVDEPSEVKVAVKADEAGEETTIELSVAKDDMGKVIGKQGRIAKAIRTVVRAASVKSEKKYRVDIL